MNCPECNEPAKSLPGGNLGAVHSTRYYRCPNCDIKIKVAGPVVQIMTDEPQASFKSSREASRVLRQAMADDKRWFGEITADTLDLALQTLPVLPKKSKGPAARRNGIGFGKRKKNGATL